MRILTFTSLFPDSTRPNFGVFIYQRMAHVAKRAGNAVTVVAPVPWVPSWLRGKQYAALHAVPREERFGNLQVYHPRYPYVPKLGIPFHGLLIAIGSYRTVRRLVREGMDCIDAHFVYPDGFAAVLLGKLFHVPVVASARGTDINLFPSMPTIRPLLKWTVRNAQGLIGVCNALSETMVELGAKKDLVKTIGNGVDSTRFYPTHMCTAREHLGVPKDRRVIVSVGALIERKGFHLLIPAIHKLNKRGLNPMLYIAGEGEYRRVLEEQIRDLGLSETVTLLGSIKNEDLRMWYSAADVSCLASSREGWANVLLESMACSTPVVATRIWGTPEVVVSNDLGILVEQSIDGLADGLQSALNRDWNRTLITSFAQQRSWDFVASETEQWLARSARVNTIMPQNADAGVHA